MDAYAECYWTISPDNQHDGIQVTFNRVPQTPSEVKAITLFSCLNRACKQTSLLDEVNGLTSGQEVSRRAEIGSLVKRYPVNTILMMYLNFEQRNNDFFNVTYEIYREEPPLPSSDTDLLPFIIIPSVLIPILAVCTYYMCVCMKKRRTNRRASQAKQYFHTPSGHGHNVKFY